MDFKYSFVFAIVILLTVCGDVGGVTDMSMTADPAAGLLEIGQNVTFTCQYTLQTNEILSTVNFYRINPGTNTENMIISIAPNFANVQPGWTDRVPKVNVPVNEMTLMDVNCGDISMYKCVVVSSISDSGNPFEATMSTLDILVRPKPPVMTRQPPTDNMVTGELLTVTCEANVGRPPGTIGWTQFVGLDGSNEVDVTDQATTTQDVQGTPNCSRVLTSEYSVRVDKDLNRLVVRCYVKHAVFPSPNENVCPDKETHLCDETPAINVYYPVESVAVSASPTFPEQGRTVTLSCYAPSNPNPTFTWVKDGDENATLPEDSVTNNGETSSLTLTDLDIDKDSGEYNCTAENTYRGQTFSIARAVRVTVVATTTTSTTTESPTTTEDKAGSTDTSKTDDDDDDKTTIIIIVVVVVVVVILILVVVGFVIYKRRQPKKEIEEPPEKPYNNRTNMTFTQSQPDLVADEKKFNDSFNNSIDMKNEDGLMYADLTYDNRPRSRKPLAIGENGSDYSDVQMPQV